MTELARLIELEGLLDLSQFEQELVCDDDHGVHLKALCEKIADPKVQAFQKLQLALLYALRYEERPEQAANLSTVKTALTRFGVPSNQIALIDAMLQYAGVGKRAPGLFGSLTDRFKKRMQTTLQGINNVYTRHEPIFLLAIDAALKGRLRENHYPGINGVIINRPSDVIVFVVGGVTFEESTKVAEMNAAAPPGTPRVILGASAIYNSHQFLDDLKKAVPVASN